MCFNWANKEKCARHNCPYLHVSKEQWEKIKKDRKQQRSKSPKRTPTPRSPTKTKSSSKSPRKSESPKANPAVQEPGKPKTPQSKHRGKSPSGKTGKPACTKWLSGTCTKGDSCDYWHTPSVRIFR